MRDDINLIEDNTRVKDVERRIVKSTSEDDIFEKLKSVGVVDLSLDCWIVNWDGLVKMSGLFEEISVVSFVGGEIGII